MNLNRLRPNGVKKENLDLWFSSVVNDACRDALEAGMSERDIYNLLVTLANMHHPHGRYGKKIKLL